MKRKITKTVFAPLLLAFIFNSSCFGQDGDNAGADQVASSEASKSVELIYGMSRNQVIEALGNPEFESIIDSLQRARIVYADDTVLFFDKDLLVLVRTVDPPATSVDGFAMGAGADEVLKIDERLLEGKPKLREPTEEHQLMGDRAFFFASSPGVMSDNGIYFSPANGCLLRPAAGLYPKFNQNACRPSGAADPFSRLLLRIKRDVCHVCP